MTTYVTFQPSATAPFQFQATLDGSAYTVIMPWNLHGQRYYVTCFDLSGNLIFSLPLIGSPLGYNISLSAGYFASTLIYREPTGQFEISP